MNSATHQILSRAFYENIIDYNKLIKHRYLSSNPSINERIDIAINRVNFHDPTFGIQLTSFTTQFRDKNARDRLDETVVTFLLFIGNQATEEKFRQTFKTHGGWETEYSWMMMFKCLVYTIFSLAYDVRWKDEYFFYVDDMTIDLLKGKATSLRTLAQKIGVSFSSDVYPAEVHYTKMIYHNSSIFGPFFWRMIHFVAEAFAVREQAGLAKTMWRQFTTETLYRTLSCGLCIQHYKNNILPKYKDQLLNTSDEDYPILWFRIHNEVNSPDVGGKGTTKIDTGYSASEFEKDRTFMREGLKWPNK